MGIPHSSALRIFLSSTYTDLAPYRQKIIDAIGRLGHVAINMEQFGAKTNNPLIASAYEVTHADLFIGIISNRYGAIDPTLDKSACEVEFGQAKANHIPILMYIPLGGLLANLPHSADPISETHRKRFLASIKRDTSITYEEYSDSNDLAYIITTDIVKYLTTADQLQGRAALQLQDYSSAIRQLRVAHERRPDDGTIAFLYALALLRGRSPGRIKERGEIVQIEELLRIALMQLKAREVAAFWGVLKQDFWVQKFGYDRHEAQLLFQSAQDFASSRELYTLLLIVQPDVMIRFAEFFG